MNVSREDIDHVVGQIVERFAPSAFYCLVRELGLSRSELARLSTFGVATRYPGMDADPEASREAMDTAASVRRAVREGLGSE